MNAGTSLALLSIGAGIASLFVGLIAGNLVQICIMVAKIRPDRWINLATVSRKAQGQLLRFSVPLCLASASYWLLAGFARLSVIYFDGAGNSGLLAVGFRFGFVVSAVTSVLVYAWNELLYIVHEQERRRDVQSRGARIALQAGLLATAVTVLVTHLLFDALVADDFEGARDIVPLIILATSLNSMATLLGSVFMAEGATSVLLWTTLLAAAINVALDLLFVPFFGVYGAAMILLVSFFVLLITRIVALRRRLAFRVVDGMVMWPVAAVGGSMLAYSKEDSVALTMASVVLTLGAMGAVVVGNRREKKST